MRRWIERLLLVAGFAAVCVSLGFYARNAIWQTWDNWVFEQEVHGESGSLTEQVVISVKEHVVAAIDRGADQLRRWFGSPAMRAAPVPSVSPLPTTKPRIIDESRSEKPRIIEKNALIGRLTIPRLNLRATVREGDEEKTLGVALGHIPSTALPGETGNVGVAGHRDTMFRALREIQKDDVVHFETLTGTYSYQVESTEVVDPKDVEVLAPGDHPELTLVTCYPFNYIGAAPERFIVTARQISTAGPPTVAALGDGESSSNSMRPVSQTELHAFAKPDQKKIGFDIAESHSRSLAPGISFGVDHVDPYSGQVNGWMWLMPDRRTIWVKRQPIGQPLFFYTREDGRTRELVITRISRNRVAGYLLEPD